MLDKCHYFVREHSSVGMLINDKSYLIKQFFQARVTVLSLQVGHRSDDNEGHVLCSIYCFVYLLFFWVFLD